MGALMRWRFRAVVFTVSLLAVAGAARADGYEAPRVAAPVMLQVSNWTGFYANGGVGYGLWDAQTTVVDPVTGACAVCETIDHGGRGWLGEIGVGYDYQIGDKIVLGAFFNYDFSDMKGTISDASLPASGKTNNDSTWFVGARGGWLMTPAVLNYWGIGYTQTHFGGANLTGCGCGYSTPGFTVGGWFISGGLEVAMHDGWFWRSEVRYSDYSKEAVREVGPIPFDINFDPVVETATTEIVYKFNWGH
jgi:outer membrane immunogenic protein